MDGGARLPNDPGRHWNPRWFVSIGEIRTTKCAEPFFPGVPSTYSDDTTGTAARQVSGTSKAIEKSARRYLRLRCQAIREPRPTTPALLKLTLAESLGDRYCPVPRELDLYGAVR